MKLIIDQNSLGIQIEYDIIMMCYLIYWTEWLSNNI